MNSTKQNHGGYATQNLNTMSSPAQVSHTVDSSSTQRQSAINNTRQYPQSMQQPQNTAAENTKAPTQQYTFPGTEDYRIKVEEWRKSVSETHGEFDFDMDSASAVGSAESSGESGEMKYTMNGERSEDDEEASGISSDSDPDGFV